jgi:hypothetical protein
MTIRIVNQLPDLIGLFPYAQRITTDTNDRAVPVLAFVTLCPDDNHCRTLNPNRLTIQRSQQDEGKSKKAWYDIAAARCGTPGRHLTKQPWKEAAMPNRPVNITGQRFGRLVAIKPAGEKRDHIFWLCHCDCNTEKVISGRHLRNGNTISCGCARDGLQNRTHGCAGQGNITSEYRTWIGMLNRCTNTNNPAFKYYGARGITVCERWKKFENFLSDMGLRPKGLTIDRINNDGNYEQILNVMTVIFMDVFTQRVVVANAIIAITTVVA